MVFAVLHYPAGWGVFASEDVCCAPGKGHNLCWQCAWHVCSTRPEFPIVTMTVGSNASN